MSGTVAVKPIKAFAYAKPGGASAHYVKGGDYNVRPEIAEAMREAGALEDGEPLIVSPTPPEFIRPTVLEPEDTGDIIADED